MHKWIHTETLNDVQLPLADLRITVDGSRWQINAIYKATHYHTMLYGTLEKVAISILPEKIASLIVKGRLDCCTVHKLAI